MWDMVRDVVAVRFALALQMPSIAHPSGGAQLWYEGGLATSRDNLCDGAIGDAFGKNGNLG
jgi:hypothetical protein